MFKVLKQIVGDAEFNRLVESIFETEQDSIQVIYKALENMDKQKQKPDFRSFKAQMRQQKKEPISCSRCCSPLSLLCLP